MFISVACTAGLAALLLLLRIRRRSGKRKSARELMSECDTAGDSICMHSVGSHSVRTTSTSMDGELNPDEIQICKRPDGSDWLLGQGNFGKVRFGHNSDHILRTNAGFGPFDPVHNYRL